MHVHVPRHVEVRWWSGVSMVLLGFRVDDAPVAEVGGLVRWVAVVGLCWLYRVNYTGQLSQLIYTVYQISSRRFLYSFTFVCYYTILYCTVLCSLFFPFPSFLLQNGTGNARAQAQHGTGAAQFPLKVAG